jgi:transcriptional regulator with XRE-family HTH domain
MTQDHLAQQLGVTFQQIQKYEKGVNRISAARLYEIFRVLDVPIASMFEDIPRNAPTSKKKRQHGLASKEKAARLTRRLRPYRLSRFVCATIRCRLRFLTDRRRRFTGRARTSWPRNPHGTHGR